jgi:hypothetical protein
VFIHEGEVPPVALVFTLIFYMKKSPVGLPRSRVILSPNSYSLKQIVELNNTTQMNIVLHAEGGALWGRDSRGYVFRSKV